MIAPSGCGSLPTDCCGRRSTAWTWPLHDCGRRYCRPISTAPALASQMSNRGCVTRWRDFWTATTTRSTISPGGLRPIRSATKVCSPAAMSWSATPSRGSSRRLRPSMLVPRSTSNSMTAGSVSSPAARRVPARGAPPAIRVKAACFDAKLSQNVELVWGPVNQLISYWLTWEDIDGQRHIPARCRRILWHVLAGIRRLRRCRAGGGFSKPRDRFSRCCFRVWPDSVDHGLRRRSHLWRPFQLCGHDRLVERRALRQQARDSLHNRASYRGDHRRGNLVDNRIEPTRLDSRPLCGQRLWRSEPRQIWSRGLLSHGSGDDLFLSLRHHRHYLKGCGNRFCRHSDRPRADPHPSSIDSGH